MSEAYQAVQPVPPIKACDEAFDGGGDPDLNRILAMRLIPTHHVIAVKHVDPSLSTWLHISSD